MNIKEHLQFFVLMIPTLLLLVAAVITLAAPSGGTASPRANEATGAEPHARQELAVVVDTEGGPLNAVAAR